MLDLAQFQSVRPFGDRLEIVRIGLYPQQRLAQELDRLPIDAIANRIRELRA